MLFVAGLVCGSGRENTFVPYLAWFAYVGSWILHILSIGKKYAQESTAND